jgi:hypothetical protein
LSAADHGGALLGAASAGLFLLPAAGLQVTAVLIAAAKLVSLAGLLAAGRPGPREAACGPELDDRPSAV